MACKTQNFSSVLYLYAGLIFILVLISVLVPLDPRSYRREFGPHYTNISMERTCSILMNCWEGVNWTAYPSGIRSRTGGWFPLSFFWIFLKRLISTPDLFEMLSFCASGL